MVRKKNAIPPVYPAALGAACLFYVPLFSGLSRQIFFFAACAVLFFLSAAVAARPVLQITGGKSRACAFVMALAFGALAGFLSSARMALGNEPPSSLLALERVSALRGTLLEDPSPYGARYYRARARTELVSDGKGTTASARGECVLAIPVDLAREANPGSVRVTDGRIVPYAKGARLELSGRFVTRRDGLDEASLFVVDDGAAPPAMLLSWDNGLSRARASLRLSLARTLYDWGAAGGFLFALISGNRDYLDPGLASDFSRCGLAHVLALSGTHLSLLALVVLKAGKRVAGKRLSVALSILAMASFVWFAGGSPSLNRALVFALIAVSVSSLGLEVRMLPILAAASLVQLVINPVEVASLAFLLSVTALWGILTFGESARYLAERHLPPGVLGEISASAGAQLMTAPVLAAFIGVLAPSGLMASCIVSPLSSVYIVAGSALLAASSAFPMLSVPFGQCLSLLYGAIAGCARFFAQFPVIEPRVLPASIAAGIIPLVAGIAVSVASSTSRKRRSLNGAFAGL